MHTFLFPKWERVDHIDGDGLNNTRLNLRQCSHAENIRNSAKSISNKSGCKGVIWDKNRSKWMAYIKLDYRQKYLGRYDTFEEASEARDRAAKEMHGPFART